MSEKSKAKMRDARKGDFKAVYCLETGCVYSSIHEAARELGLFATNISAVCRGKHKHTKGYRFIYADTATSTYTPIFM